MSHRRPHSRRRPQVHRRPQARRPARVQLLDRLAVIARHYKAVLVIAALVTTGMMSRVYTITPMYTATARLHIEGEQAARSFDDRTAAYQDTDSFYQTQYEILQSRDLAQRAVRRLTLATVPEFNGEGPAPTKVNAISTLVVQKMLAPFRAAPAVLPSARSVGEGGLIAAFQSRLRVTPVNGSRLVDVSFTSTDARRAADAVNVLAEEYVARNIERRRMETDSSLQRLKPEVDRQQQSVQGAERLLAEYRANQHAVPFDSRQNLVTMRLSEITYAVTTAQTERVRREAVYRQAAESAHREALGSVLQNRAVLTLRARLTETERGMSDLLERYGDKHPLVQERKAQAEHVQRQIDAEIEKTVNAMKNDYETAAAQERSLAQALDQETAAATDLSRTAVDYTVLVRDAKSNRDVYESLLQREKHLEVVSNSRENNVRLLDRAPVPAAADGEDIERAWMIALLVGLGLGAAGAFVLEHVDDTVKTPEDVRSRLNVRFLGLVPIVHDVQQPLLSGKVPHDFGEAFRAVRTALVMTNATRPTRIVGVTSAQRGEGKTTTAVNMALALTIGGARVLLVDADMRRPNLHKALRISNDQGLSDVLAGRAHVRDVIREGGNANLQVLTAGRLPENPSELLASMTMKVLLEELAAGPFDWVIIDTPPVLAVTDAVILAPLVSSMTFVLGAETTRLRLAERALDTLMAAGPQSVNAVLNKVDCHGYYYTRYYGRSSGNYYAETSVAA